MEEGVYPTDILGSGGAAGGHGTETDRWLKLGDLMEIEVANIWVLLNRVVRR